MKPTKLSDKVVNVLQERITDEYSVSFFYRTAANWCYDKGFKKAGDWFKSEADEEITHAQKVLQYITDWNVLPEISPIAAPQVNFKSLVEILEIAYKFEYDLYQEYEDASAKVLEWGEICTFDFLQELRKIQNDSVIEASDRLNLLEGVDESDKFQMLVLQEQLFG